MSPESHEPIRPPQPKEVAEADVPKEEAKEKGVKKRPDIFPRLEKQLSPRKKSLYDEFIETIGGNYGKLAMWLLELLIRADEKGTDFIFLEKALKMCMSELVAQGNALDASMQRTLFVRDYVKDKMQFFKKQAASITTENDPRVTDLRLSYAARMKGKHASPKRIILNEHQPRGHRD